MHKPVPVDSAGVPMGANGLGGRVAAADPLLTDPPAHMLHEVPGGPETGRSQTAQRTMRPATTVKNDRIVLSLAHPAPSLRQPVFRTDGSSSPACAGPW